jgi:hypothetical protein
MKRDLFVKQMARLMQFFESELTTLKIEGYWEEMKFIPGKAFEAGVTKVIQTREYPSFPVPGTLLKAAVGDHAHVVSARLPHGRDVQLDDIVGAYKERWESRAERQKLLTDGSGIVPPIVEKENVITELRIEKARLEADNQLLRHRVASVEGLLAEATAAMATYRETVGRQGKELARLEKIHREERAE